MFTRSANPRNMTRDTPRCLWSRRTRCCWHPGTRGHWSQATLHIVCSHVHSVWPPVTRDRKYKRVGRKCVKIDHKKLAEFTIIVIYHSNFGIFTLLKLIKWMKKHLAISISDRLICGHDLIKDKKTLWLQFAVERPLVRCWLLLYCCCWTILHGTQHCLAQSPHGHLGSWQSRWWLSRLLWAPFTNVPRLRPLGWTDPYRDWAWIEKLKRVLAVMRI